MSVFDLLIDQDEVVEVLTGAVAAARDDKNKSQVMTHAWLFTGPPGSGRSNAAVAFAAALVCDKGGCGECVNCRSALAGTHGDVELIRTEGLSIKIDEIRELITRAAWAPSVGEYRVVVIEDADRLTESAANALLKAIEEPGAHTVWLLCAPTATDVLPTIRSRVRSLILRTPSIDAVAALLIKEGISQSMAEFAARAASGHVGRARYLAKSPEARARRESTLKLALSINDIASAFRSAGQLVDSAKAEAEEVAEVRDADELKALKEAWGQTGSRLAQGGSKAVKELEKEQKSRATRMVRDYLDQALLDIVTLYRDILLIQSGKSGGSVNADLTKELEKVATSTTSDGTLKKIEAIMKARVNLAHNAAPLLTVEAMMVQLK
jgi:DNA polymerase-3 subunit delta'